MGGGAGVPRAAGGLPVWLTHRRKYDAWGPMCRCADVADALITDTDIEAVEACICRLNVM